jgi:hypothetical protein
MTPARSQPKREAIETLESAGFTGAEAQMWTQSSQGEATVIVEHAEKIFE